MACRGPKASRSTIDLPAMETGESRQRLRVLVASAGSEDLMLGEGIIPRLGDQSNLVLRGLFDHAHKGKFVIDGVPIMRNMETNTSTAQTYENSRQTDLQQHKIAALSAWTDLLVLAPIDTNTLAKMLNGMSDNVLLEILRGWDVSKKILLVPGMSVPMWENPMTRKQLNKLRRKWNWIRVLQPILWDYDEDSIGKKVAPWDGMEELIEAIRNQADLMTIGQDVDVTLGTVSSVSRQDRPNLVNLPPEIWTMIYDYVGDWEVAKSLGVYTNLPTPTEWERQVIKDDLHAQMRALEWTILTGSFKDIVAKLDSNSPHKWLSRLCVKLIIKFARTDLLSYLEKHHKDLFWATFGHTLLPSKASAAFGKVAILEWWRTSPSFLTKEYHPDAVDGASKAGFVHVLDWWHKSGLPLRYTEASLEQASSHGNVEVLDWWKNASLHQGGGYQIEADTLKYGASRVHQHTSIPPANPPEPNVSPAGPLRLKVGKSICFAAQNGQASTIAWWDSSGIPYTHEETVAKIASQNGHVNVLQVWKELKGEKMILDNQVLVGPTKNGHADVLEWWKRSGFRIEYKTCDIEEALEDSLGGKGEERVRVWWARNGLNLGIGTSEWMKVKVL